MFKKFLILLVLILHQSSLQSKDNYKNNFNQKYLSNYFSALVSINNQDNDKALNYFTTSKNLLKRHKNFLRNFTLSLVENNQVEKAINEIKKNKKEEYEDFFEAKILLFTEEIKKGNFKNARAHIKKLHNSNNKDTFENIVIETLLAYTDLFINKKISKTKSDFGKLNHVTNSFQNCYLDSKDSIKYFKKLIESEEIDYSRYLFFYFQRLIENNDLNTVTKLSNEINTLNSNLLISQSKKWVKNKDFFKFEKLFSCSNESDLISEFFFLIANLYSSQEYYKSSNFYLIISSFLNSKFIYNNSLLAENYFVNNNYNRAKFYLNKFNKDDQSYNWFKTKKLAQIIYKEQNEAASLQFIEKKVLKYKNPDIKIYFDTANIYKNFKKYKKSIEFYDLVLKNTKKNDLSYADVLYRRGSSYERMGNYVRSDADLINSIEIIDDDPYVLNYLAYSWLERNYQVDLAMEMLIKAHSLKKNDPYIADSLGWGYFLIGEYKKAEEYLNLALQIKPNDSVITDHYADTLWMLNRKIQAKYLWKSVLKNSDSVEIDKDKIKEKILKGKKKF